jgi:hypothetical protein
MMRNFVSRYRRLLAIAALFACAMSCWAQANIRTVLLVKVKNGHDDSWKAAVKDYVATMKKAGSEEQFTVWESQSGPSLHAVVWYSTKWKELGEDNPKLKGMDMEIATLFRRLDADTDSLETWVDEMQPDFMIRSKEVPPFVRTGRTRVVSGKMDEVKALFRDQIVPAYKKAGTTDYGVAVARFGTPSNEFHSYLGVNGWGDFDSPFGIEKGMTPAEYKAFLAKVGPLVEWTQWDLWKYEPELSYLVPAK